MDRSSERIARVAGHLRANPTASSRASPDDIVICCAVRTAVTKGKRGGFKDTPPEEMLAAVLRAVVERTRVDPAVLGEINVGNVLCPGGGAVMARMGQFLAGIPETVPLSTVNRQCSSGLQAVANVAAGIRAGFYDVAIGAGVESMSTQEMTDIVNPEKISPQVFENERARNCLMPMGITSENVAEKYNVSREVQDRMAVESHARAARAQAAGLFAEEIVPVATKVKDANGNATDVTVAADDGVRKETTLESLQKLKPAFKKGGTTTAGNSSQVSDGAAAVLVARRSAAERLGLPVVAVFRAYSVVGVPPEIMGVGPAVAIPEAVRRAGLQLGDIDIFEINEAFASQASYTVQHLGISPAKVNPKGGAIALGHPLGCTGARQIATLLPELRRTGKKRGVVSMCIGTGMGAAAVIELA